MVDSNQLSNMFDNGSIHTQTRCFVVAHGCVDNTHMQELGGRLLKLAGTDVVSDSQSVDA